MGNEELRNIARRLRDLVEPIAANVYFAPEAANEYEALGVKGFAPGYFPSRGGCLGQVPGEVIAAAFGVFKPAMVKEAVDGTWAILGRPSRCDTCGRPLSGQGLLQGLGRVRRTPQTL